MDWILDKKKPICPQLCEQICVRIDKGEFEPNQKLLSVRDVALTAGVNPNTVQRSFEDLERMGIVYSIRGSGWYVSEDITFAKDTLERMLQEKTTAYFADMNLLGMQNDEIKNYVKEWEQ